MPSKNKRPSPYLIALVVTSAHHNSGAPVHADEVIAAKAIGVSRRKRSDTFFSYSTNKEGSAFQVSLDFVEWLISHTESPVCVVVGLDKFSNTAIGRMICLSGCHLRVLDLASLASGAAADLGMLMSITDTICHDVADPKDGHIPPRREAEFIEAQLKERFVRFLPLAMRRQMHKARPKYKN